MYLRHDGNAILGATCFLSSVVIHEGKVTSKCAWVPLFSCVNCIIVLGWWCFCLILWEASHQLSWWHPLYWAWSCVAASWVNFHTPFSLCWISVLCPCYHHPSCDHNLHTCICTHTCALTMTALHKVWMHSQWLLYNKFGCYTVNRSCKCDFFWEVKMFYESHQDMINGITLWNGELQSWASWSVWRGVVHTYQCFGRKLPPILC